MSTSKNFSEDLRQLIISKGLIIKGRSLPRSPFRFESPVTLGDLEIHPGVSIGSHSYINDGGLLRSGVVIGRFCSIGRFVIIGTGHHELNSLSTSPFFSKQHRASSLKLADPTRRIRVQIGNDVWIGDRVTILSGVSVGDGAVLATGSIITKDVPPYAIVAGVPGRVIKYRFSENIIIQLLSIKWWEFKDKFLSNLNFSNISSVIVQLNNAIDIERIPVVYEKL
jgi:acetyltransferase-like isoleucine patch superfamily enzyme